MALKLKQPIATLHPKERHISVKPFRNPKRNTEKKTKARKFKQLHLF